MFYHSHERALQQERARQASLLRDYQAKQHARQQLDEELWRRRARHETHSGADGRPGPSWGPGGSGASSLAALPLAALHEHEHRCTTHCCTSVIYQVISPPPSPLRAMTLCLRAQATTDLRVVVPVQVGTPRADRPGRLRPHLRRHSLASGRLRHHLPARLNPAGTPPGIRPRRGLCSRRQCRRTWGREGPGASWLGHARWGSSRRPAPPRAAAASASAAAAAAAAAPAAPTAGRSAGSRPCRRAYAKACLRWHPDKFQHRLGRALSEAHAGQILARVQGISQGINRAWEEVRQEWDA